MKRSEVGQVLRVVRALEGRPAPTEEEILAWAMVDELMALRVGDVVEAAKRHAVHSAKWVTLHDLIEGVKIIRRERGMNRRPELNPINPDDVARYVEWDQRWVTAVCDGLTDKQATERACREMAVPLPVQVTPGRTIDLRAVEASTRMPRA